MLYKFIALAAVLIFALSVIITGCSQTTALNLISENLEEDLAAVQMEYNE